MSPPKRNCKARGNSNSMSNHAEAPLDTLRVGSLLATMEHLYLDKAFTDLKINVADTILHAHSSVLSAQCPYFSKALLRKCTGQDGHNVVPRFIKSENREFNFPEGSVQAYARVTRYLYLRNYSDEPDMELNTPDDEELTRDVRVYQLADYFGIDDLQVYALGKFKTKAKSLWMSQGFIDCIPEVYASTTDAQCQTRRAIIDIICEHSEDIWKEPLKNLLCVRGEHFAADLLNRLSSAIGSSLGCFENF